MFDLNPKTRPLSIRRDKIDDGGGAARSLSFSSIHGMGATGAKDFISVTG
jgi:hypothetical protein